MLCVSPEDSVSRKIQRESIGPVDSIVGDGGSVASVHVRTFDLCIWTPVTPEDETEGRKREIKINLKDFHESYYFPG